MAIPPRPRIGITTDYVTGQPRYSLGYDYVTAVERAGGLPLLIPFRLDHSHIPQILDSFDGILFTGGDDLDSARWGEARHPGTVPLDAERERFDVALVAEVDRRRMPMLGICLGSQLINIHRGGSLIQFLPDVANPGAIEHRKLDHPVRHDVQVEAGTVLASALGCTHCSVNTRHKQAIGRLGRGLRVVATAPDGVIEGIEDPTHPLLLAVQWHPENLFAEDEHLGLFRTLVDAARRR